MLIKSISKWFIITKSLKSLCFTLYSLPGVANSNGFTGRNFQKKKIGYKM